MKRVLAIAFAFAIAIVVLGATPGLAHVTVNPREVTAGGFAALTFRVPTESETATTVAVEIVFPEAAPFSGVRVKPVPGWTYTIERDGDRVHGITWEGGEIGPTEFMEFDISLGPVPEVDVLEFKALQTYSDGEVVRWIDPVVEGEEPPEHPAPTATVVDGERAGDHGAEAAGAAGPSTEGTEPAAFIGLAVAGLALAGATAALVMARSRPPT